MYELLFLLLPRFTSFFIFFFFSSRRRHTRFDCDWSSDVCSSDLDDGLDARDIRRDVVFRDHHLRGERLDVAVTLPIEIRDEHNRLVARRCGLQRLRGRTGALQCSRGQQPRSVPPYAFACKTSVERALQDGFGAAEVTTRVDKSRARNVSPAPGQSHFAGGKPCNVCAVKAEGVPGFRRGPWNSESSSQVHDQSSY